MSGRSTAEIVADLRKTEDDWDNTLPLGSCNCRNCTRLYHEAADRLAALDAGRWSPPTGERISGVPPWQAGRRLS